MKVAAGIHKQIWLLRCNQNLSHSLSIRSYLSHSNELKNEQLSSDFVERFLLPYQKLKISKSSECTLYVCTIDRKSSWSSRLNWDIIHKFVADNSDRWQQNSRLYHKIWIWCVCVWCKFNWSTCLFFQLRCTGSDYKIRENWQHGNKCVYALAALS